MRSGLTMIGVGLIALGAFVTPSLAQTPPDQIRDWPGLTYLGVIGGLEAWTVEGSEVLWMRAPDGRALIRGEMFSAAGRDLGSALLGTDPTPLQRAPSPTDWSAATSEMIGETLNLSASDAFSVLIGEETAPEVWAWMDPSDPVTAATYMMLRDRIRAGQIALRVIPVVTSDPASSDWMRRVLSLPSPIDALTGTVQGALSISDAVVDEENLSRNGELIARILRNGTLAAQINPPTLPFLLWAEEGGAAAYAGVPDRDLFGSVIRTSPVPAPDEGMPAPSPSPTE